MLGFIRKACWLLLDVIFSFSKHLMQPVDINMLQSFIDSSIIHPVRMVPCE